MAWILVSSRAFPIVFKELYGEDLKRAKILVSFLASCNNASGFILIKDDISFSVNVEVTVDTRELSGEVMEGVSVEDVVREELMDEVDGMRFVAEVNEVGGVGIGVFLTNKEIPS